MSVIAVSVEPDRVTRIFFDCRDAPPEPSDLRRIELAIEASNAAARGTEEADAVDETPRSHLLARRRGHALPRYH